MKAMTTTSQMFQKLQKSERKGAALYLFCNFVSLLLITAYAAMMFSPTILRILPEGGDSRKQIAAIFVLALFGCVVFTIYASCLFFRKKSKQLGILMALGASRRRLAPSLFLEVILLSSSSSLLGILAGLPFVQLIWNAFRLLIIDSNEMQLILDYRCLLLSALFFVLVVFFSCITAYRYLKRTDIMDVIHEEHKNEPVKKPGRWCGPVGILLLVGGAVSGYLAPSIYCTLLNAYMPPMWLNLLYAPVFVGLYMIMLHTVVYGWRSHKKHPYKNIISRSMVLFCGRQTVNNLLVSTVLLAGAAFAIFYLPMLSMPNAFDIANRPYPYSFRYPNTLAAEIPSHEAIRAIAQENGVSITSPIDVTCLVLGTDGYAELPAEDNSAYREYRTLLGEGRFLSAADFCRLTGQTVSVNAGTYYMISNDTETNTYWGSTDITLLTNMTTRATHPVTCAGFLHYTFLSGRIPFYVLNDADYAAISRDIGADWTETLSCFSIDGADSYAFANDFFTAFLRAFPPEYATPSYYDRVGKIYCEEHQMTYWGDTDAMTKLSLSAPDSTDFRTYWLYMPKIAMLDKTDFVRTYAVFLMMFLFISIICILAALIISYTRCMTIALNNRYVFDDLKKLGASPAFLLREVRAQARKVYAAPAAVGMGAMFFLYTLLMYGNDGVLSMPELAGLGVCLLAVLLLSTLVFAVYRHSVKSMAAQLSI